MFKLGSAMGRGFLGSLLATGRLAGDDILGPSAPIAGSSFRQRGHKKMLPRPPNDTGWYRRSAELRPMPITERMLMRHGWYRRQLREKGVAIDPNAKNAVAFVSAVSGLPLEGR